MQSIRPVGPGSLSSEGLQALLSEMRRAVMDLQTPRGPVRLASVEEADLPPATDFDGALIYVSDLQKVAMSNGTTWTDTTGGAL